MEAILYHNPSCQKSREAKAVLDATTVVYTVRKYLIETPTADELKKLAKKLGLKPLEMVRKKEPAFRALGLDKPGVTDDQVIKAIVDQPILLERPILVRGDKAVIGRPTERIKELL